MFYYLLKNALLLTLIQAELELAFRFFNPLFMMDRFGWSGLVLVIVVIGFDLAIYWFLFRRHAELDRKIAMKIFRIHDYK
jgi:hypothetical protein